MSQFLTYCRTYRIFFFLYNELYFCVFTLKHVLKLEIVNRDRYIINTHINMDMMQHINGIMVIKEIAQSQVAKLFYMLCYTSIAGF